MSTVLDILTELHRRGVSVKVDGDELILKPRRAVDTELLSRVREHKPEILRIVASSAYVDARCTKCGVVLKHVTVRTAKEWLGGAHPTHHCWVGRPWPPEPTHTGREERKPEIPDRPGPETVKPALRPVSGKAGKGGSIERAKQILGLVDPPCPHCSGMGQCLCDGCGKTRRDDEGHIWIHRGPCKRCKGTGVLLQRRYPGVTSPAKRKGSIGDPNDVLL